MTDIPQALIDKHRYCNTEFEDWFEHIREDFEDEMNLHGIAVEDIYFSLGHCQSDYANFNGWVKNWRRLLEHIGYDCDALTLLADQAWVYKWEDTGVYSQMCFSNHMPAPNSADDITFAYQYAPQKWVDESQKLRMCAWLSVIDRYDIDQIANEIKEAIQKHCNDLYRRMMKEFEYLTSDEAVTETIIANNWHLEGE